MILLTPTLLLLSFFKPSYAGTLGRGEQCSVSNNRLQIGTYQYWDECNAVTFCSEVSGTCTPRRCRRDEYPFGYTPGMTFPDKCPKGQFCPDEGSDCQSLLAVGSPCQLNRDDQCAPPPNWEELADTTGRGLNWNGSVCLNNVCMYADATEGSDCVLENTAYIAYGLDDEFNNIVSRGNCRIGLYCDGPTRKCLANKLEGEQCEADKECESMNCMANGVCGVPAATPHKFGVWAYVLVAIGMTGTLIGLYLAHRKQRDQEREKRLQYWREQNAFHQNLMQMREAARASILSLPNGQGGSPRSTIYGRDLSDESHAQLLGNTSGAPKSSGLRHYVGDDSSDFEDLNQPARKTENRF